MASLLEQLKSMTTIVADTGDVEAIKTLKPVDATTNPSLLLKASTLPQYAPLIDDAIAYAKKQGGSKEHCRPRGEWKAPVRRFSGAA